MKTQIAFLVAGLFACSAFAYPGLLSPVTQGLSSTLTSVTNGVQVTAAQLDPTLQTSLDALKQIIQNKDLTIEDNARAAAVLLDSALTLGLTFDQVYAYVLKGVYIAKGPNTNTTNSLGGLGLPTATLCQLGLHYEYTSCYICNEDCYVAHNLWGGGCGTSPVSGAVNQTCLCADSQAEADERHLTPDSKDTCAKYNPVAGEESFLIAVVFRARYIAVQCLVKPDGTYDSTGCNVDCTQNHGFVSGTCAIQKPNVPMPTGTYVLNNNDESSPFCICSHNSSPNTTFNDPAYYSGGNLITGALSYLG